MSTNSSIKAADFIFERGDVDIKVKLPDGTMVTGKVSAEAMALASPVWKKFMYPPWQVLAQPESGSKNLEPGSQSDPGQGGEVLDANVQGRGDGERAAKRARLDSYQILGLAAQNPEVKIEPEQDDEVIFVGSKSLKSDNSDERNRSENITQGRAESVDFSEDDAAPLDPNTPKNPWLVLSTIHFLLINLTCS